MNFHQTPEEIIKNANAPQRIMWNHLFLTYGEKIGLSQLYFIGAVAGTEFTIYSANKLYVALDLSLSNGNNAGAGQVQAELYNAGNGLEIICRNCGMVWTGAAIQYNSQNMEFTNLTFSRMVFAGLDYIRFIGYRLSI